MRYLKKFFEKTKMDKWYEENPNGVKSFDIPTLKSMDIDEKRIFRNLNDVSSNEKERINDIISSYPNLNKPIDKKKENIGHLGLYKRDSILEYLLEGYSLTYYFEDYINGKTSDINFNNFNEVFEKIKMGLYNPDINEELVKDLSENWSDYLSMIKEIYLISDYDKNKAIKKAKKIARRNGIDYQSFIKVIAWINYYQSSSYKKLPKEVWEAIHYLTVNPNNLPKTIYRGMFYDGAKIKDKAKFEEKWYKGNKPNVKFRKASSWSTDISTAKSFCIDQDGVKDNENGYHVLLKYDIKSADDIIGDFRNVDWLNFWNQQEIILNPSVKDYEIVDIIPYDNEFYKNKEFGTKTEGYYSGYSGMNKKELLKWDIHNIYKSTFDKEKVYDLLRYKDMTLRETGLDFHIIKDEVMGILLPLYQLINNIINEKISINKVISKDEVSININLKCFNGECIICSSDWKSENHFKVKKEEIEDIKVNDIKIKSIKRSPMLYIYEINLKSIDNEDVKYKVKSAFEEYFISDIKERYKNIRFKYTL